MVDDVNGFVLAERARESDQPGQSSDWKELQAILGERQPERVPARRSVLGSVSVTEPSGGFETGLDIILAGIVAVAAGGGRGGRASRGPAVSRRRRPAPR